jgi:DNA-binding transcriptional ArsR family regulator
MATTTSKISAVHGCRPKSPLSKRRLVNGSNAERLGLLFKMLSHPTRLRMIHALIRRPDMGVTDLADILDMTVQAVSNQLQRLAAEGLVDSRREGVHVLYRVIDPCVPVLIERAWCHVEEYQGERRPTDHV